DAVEVAPSLHLARVHPEHAARPERQRDEIDHVREGSALDVDQQVEARPLRGPETRAIPLRLAQIRELDDVDAGEGAVEAVRDRGNRRMFETNHDRAADYLERLTGHAYRDKAADPAATRSHEELHDDRHRRTRPARL